MKIVVVDNCPVVRLGFKSILADDKSIEEIIEASSIEKAMNILSTEDIEIAIISLKLHQENGLDIVEKAKEAGLKTKFILVVYHISQDNFQTAESLGVQGYITKEALAEDILYSINIVHRRKKYYDPEILNCNEQLNMGNKSNQLTARENDVLNEISRGFTNEEIASSLCISEHTVKKHVSNILSKLNLSNRTQAALILNNNVHM